MSLTRSDCGVCWDAFARWWHMCTPACLPAWQTKHRQWLVYVRSVLCSQKTTTCLAVGLFGVDQWTPHYVLLYSLHLDKILIRILCCIIEILCFHIFNGNLFPFISKGSVSMLCSFVLFCSPPIHKSTRNVTNQRCSQSRCRKWMPKRIERKKVQMFRIHTKKTKVRFVSEFPFGRKKKILATHSFNYIQPIVCFFFLFFLFVLNRLETGEIIEMVSGKVWAYVFIIWIATQDHN